MRRAVAENLYDVVTPDDDRAEGAGEPRQPARRLVHARVVTVSTVAGHVRDKSKRSARWGGQRRRRPARRARGTERAVNEGEHDGDAEGEGEQREDGRVFEDYGQQL